MSTGIGTLQAPAKNRSIWPAAVIASLLMLTIGIGAFFLGRDPATPAPKTNVGGTEQTVVAGTAANTPSELSGGIVGGAAATTLGVTAGSSSIAVAATADVQAAIIAARNAADADSGGLSGGIVGGATEGWVPTADAVAAFERTKHQRI